MHVAHIHVCSSVQIITASWKQAFSAKTEEERLERTKQMLDVVDTLGGP